MKSDLAYMVFGRTPGIGRTPKSVLNPKRVSTKSELCPRLFARFVARPPVTVSSATEKTALEDGKQSHGSHGIVVPSVKLPPRLCPSHAVCRDTGNNALPPRNTFHAHITRNTIHTHIAYCPSDELTRLRLFPETAIEIILGEKMVRL